MSAPITNRIDWQGVLLSITFHERRWNLEFDHLEIRVIGEGEIPITETGYRSNFLPAGITAEFGGPDDYVRAWLDFEAQSPEWKKRQEAARQMSLF